MVAAPNEDLVTVVVPARNEESSIRACLDSILAQEWRNIEVIVVDGDSTDATPAIVLDYQIADERVRVIKNPDRVIPVSLNLALTEARGSWLVRVDAHATIPPDYVRRAVDHLRTGAWGGVGGRKDGTGVTPSGRAISAAMASRFGVGGSAYHFATETQETDHVPFGAYPVATLREIGGWNESLRVNQDFELDYRLRERGHRILFDPAMYINWESRQSISALAKQYHRYGQGKAQVALLHPRSVSPRHTAAPALVAWLAASALVATRRPAAATAMASPYVIALAGASWSVARRLEPPARPFVAPAFVAMHISWGVGFWQGALSTLGRRSRLGRGSRGSESHGTTEAMR